MVGSQAPAVERHAQREQIKLGKKINILQNKLELARKCNQIDVLNASGDLRCTDSQINCESGSGYEYRQEFRCGHWYARNLRIQYWAAPEGKRRANEICSQVGYEEALRTIPWRWCAI